jgi:hypothetical protein
MPARVPTREVTLHTALLHKQRAIRLQLAPFAIKPPLGTHLVPPQADELRSQGGFPCSALRTAQVPSKLMRGLEFVRVGDFAQPPKFANVPAAAARCDQRPIVIDLCERPVRRHPRPFAIRIIVAHGRLARVLSLSMTDSCNASPNLLGRGIRIGRSQRSNRTLRWIFACDLHQHFVVAFVGEELGAEGVEFMQRPTLVVIAQ